MHRPSVLSRARGKGTEDLRGKGGKGQRDVSIKAGKDAFKKESPEAQPREPDESQLGGCWFGPIKSNYRKWGEELPEFKR